MRFLEDSSRHYFDSMETRTGARVFTMHDPLAVAAAIDPSLIATQRVAVDVETTGALTSGMTVADWRGVWRRPPNADVAIAVEATRSSTSFSTRWNDWRADERADCAQRISWRPHRGARDRAP